MTTDFQDDDIYGISPSPEPFVASPRFSKMVKDSEKFEEEEKKPLSLDEIYERKRREKQERDLTGESDLEPVERVALPQSPFIDGILTPLLVPGVVMRFSMMVATGTLPFLLAVRLFGSLLEKRYLEEGYKLTHFINCLVQDKVILFVFCAVWGGLCIPYILYIFSATAEGDDQLEDWPEYSFIGGLGQFLWLALLVIISGIPGYVIGQLLVHPFIGFTLSAMFIAPIFFLSCMESDAPFMLLTKTVVRSFRSLGLAWLKFYLCSFILLLLTMVGIIVPLLSVRGRHDSYLLSLALAFAISLTVNLVPILYLRYLGRLAWIISDNVRKTEQLLENLTTKKENVAISDKKLFEQK